MTSILSHLSAPALAAPLPVLAFIAKATLLLFVALLAAAALRRASAGARHIVWVGALAALVLLPVLSHWTPWRLEIGPSELGAMTQSLQQASQQASLQSAPPAPAEQVQGMRMSPAAKTSRSAEPEFSPPSLDAKQFATATPSSIAPQQEHVLTGAAVWLILLSLWAMGVCVLLARFVAGVLAVRRIVRGARLLDSADWTGPLWEVADRLDLAHAPRLMRSSEVSMPFACGLLRPTIVLPHDADTWTDDRRRAVLFHELAHVRRRDLIGHTLGRVACALYWFHPLAWTAARRLRAESERACDDLVLASGTRASEYADHLLQIVTQVRHSAAPAVALAMARRKEFEGRMLAILDPELKRTAPSRWQSAGLVLGLAALAVSVSAMVPASEQPKKLAAQQTQRTLASIPDSARADNSSCLTAFVGTGVPPVQCGPESRTHETATGRGGLIPRPGSALDIRSDDTVPTTPAPDTGERVRHHPRSIGQIVNSVVNETVEPIVNQTVAPVVDQTLSSLWNGRLDPDVDVDVHTWDDVGRTIANAVTAGFDGRSSSVRADSGTTALLVQLLQNDSSAKVRRTAAWALAQRDDRAATKPLASALEHDTSADVREMAAWGLGQSGDRAAVQALGDAVQRDSDERVKATAAWALGQIGDDAATPALDGAMADPSARVRSRAAWALGQIEPKNAPRGLVTALHDSDTRVRLTAAWALGEIEDPQTVSALSAALSAEKDHGVRKAELRALLMVGDTSDAALKELLKSPDPDIRLRATRALAGYGTGSWPWPWPMPMPRPMP